MTDPLKRGFFTPARVTGLLLIGLVLLAGWGLYPGVENAFVRTVPRDSSWWAELRADSAWQFSARCALRPACRDAIGGALRSALGWRVEAFTVLALGLVLGGVLLFTKRRGLYHAAFATLGELRRLWVSRGHEFVVPLCRVRGRWLGLTWRTRRLTRWLKYFTHVLVVAPSQSGKTVLAKGVLGSFGGSLVTVDIKGDLQADTRGCRERMSRVRVLFPERERGDLPLRTARYDPVADLGGSPEALRAAAELLVMDPHNESIFEQRAVIAARVALRAAQLQNRAAIPYLFEAIADGPTAFVERMASFQDRALRGDLTLFLDRPPETFDLAQFDEGKGFLANTWQTLLTRLEPFKTPGLLELFEGGDVRGAQLAQEVHTVYLAWPEHLLRSGTRPLALILHGLVTGMVRHIDVHGARVPTLLMLDEAAQYRIPSLPNYLATLLGRGVAVMLFIQSFAQLDAGYHEDATTIKDNCRAKLFFQPDFETAKKLSEELGFRTVRVWRETWTHQGVSRTPVDEKRELMTPDELTRLGEDEAILLFRGIRPVRAKRVEWFRDQLLRQRLALRPRIHTEHEPKT